MRTELHGKSPRVVVIDESTRGNLEMENPSIGVEVLPWVANSDNTSPTAGPI
jgi:hypothetical protein